MGNVPNVPSAHPTLGGRSLINAMSAPTTVKINFSTTASPSNKRLASDRWICDIGEAFSEQATIEVPGFRGVCVRFGWSANHAIHGRDRSLEGSSVSFGERRGQVQPAPGPAGHWLFDKKTRTASLLSHTVLQTYLMQYSCNANRKRQVLV